MNLFSEIYNCYYQVIKSILEKKSSVTKEELNKLVTEMGYEESILFLLPKLMSGEWDLFQKDGDVFIAKISSSFYVPLTTLQKSFLKSILNEEKIKLFLEDSLIQKLNLSLPDVPLLWSSDDFHYYDKFLDKDNFNDKEYINNFRTILNAIKNKQHIEIRYHSKNDRQINSWYIPCRLEYSVKNDKFRLIALKNQYHRHPKIEIINLERIEDVTLLNKFSKKRPNINKYIKHSYYKEPVHLIIKNQRNALERAMLQFANYEKNTTKIGENTYECFIYYNKIVETELLIEVLSFGPMIQAVGNKEFLEQIKVRLKNQKNCFTPSHKN